MLTCNLETRGLDTTEEGLERTRSLCRLQEKLEENEMKERSREECMLV
jgi:hypothetical protein